MLRVILFDADKTLYDIETEKAYADLFSHLASELHVAANILQKEYAAEVAKIKSSLDPAKRNYSFVLETVIRKHATQNVQTLVQNSSRLFWDLIIKHLKPKQDVISVVKNLSKQYVLVIVTDEFYSIVERKLNKIFGNWRDYFSDIVSCDKIDTMKPSPLFYREAVKLTGVNTSQMLMVGDSWKRDLAEAKKLGIATVLFAGTKEGSPDAVIHKLKELENVVTKFVNKS